MTHVLPYIEQESLHRQMPLYPANASASATFGIPVNTLGESVMAMFQCPSDPRAGTGFGGGAAAGGTYGAAGLTFYAGVGGTNSSSAAGWPASDGTLYWRSATRFAVWRSSCR